jgi:hypothetical protein
VTRQLLAKKSIPVLFFWHGHHATTTAPPTLGKINAPVAEQAATLVAKVLLDPPTAPTAPATRPPAAASASASIRTKRRSSRRRPVTQSAKYAKTARPKKRHQDRRRDRLLADQKLANWMD